MSGNRKGKVKAKEKGKGKEKERKKRKGNYHCIIVTAPLLTMVMDKPSLTLLSFLKTENTNSTF